MADTPDLGSGPARGGGSSPLARTIRLPPIVTAITNAVSFQECLWESPLEAAGKSPDPVPACNCALRFEQRALRCRLIAGGPRPGRVGFGRRWSRSEARAKRMSKQTGNTKESVGRGAQSPSHDAAATPSLPSFDYQPRTRLVFGLNSVERAGEL